MAIYWPSLSFARSWTKTDSRYSVFLSEQAWPIKDLFYAGNGPVRMLRLQLSEEFLNNFGNTRSPQSDLLPLLDRLTRVIKDHSKVKIYENLIRTSDLPVKILIERQTRSIQYLLGIGHGTLRSHDAL